MGRTRIGATTVAFGILLLLGTSAWAVPIPFETGTYHLGNHPDGNAAPPLYGARIDNLWDGGVFTFDFECVGCNMEMTYDGTTISVDGRAYGGHDVGGVHVDDAVDGLYEFHVTYDLSDVVENLGVGDGDGLQDIGMPGQTAGLTPIGTLEFLDTGMTWELKDKQGSNPASLRIGDEDNDLGHRGYDGISGWGWLMFREVGANDYVMADGSQDWLFIARRRSDAPEPGAVSILLIGLAAIATRRKTR